VKAGALLLRLDASDEAAALAQARASQMQAQAQAQLARSSLSRASALAQGGAITPQALDQANAEALAARARERAAEAEVRARSAQRRFHDNAAPFDGVVGDIPVKVGDYVTPQSTLTWLDQGGSEELLVAVDVPIARAREVRPGQTAVVLLDERGEALTRAQVTFVSPRPEESTQLVRLKAALDTG
jgi:RND family efflux transporter MFP subunit